MKDRRIVEGREMKVGSRAGMWDDEKRAERGERDGKHLSVTHSASLNWENKRGMH